jgi:peptide/nickel transport system substrate-binding protein
VRLGVALVTVAATSVTAGSTLGSASTDARTADRADTLILGIVGAPLNLDPIHADNLQNNLFEALLYDRLITFDAKGRLKNVLASSVRVSPNAKSILITLRPNVRFHDGSRLTARDVAYTLDRIKRNGQGVAGLLGQYASTSVTSNTTLVIRLKSPSTLFLGALSKVWILNSQLVGANAGSDDGQAWLQTHDAGSGPYQYQGQQGQSYTTTLFKGYWGGTAGRPPAINLQLFNLSATERDALGQGNIDVALNLSNVDAQSLKEDKSLITRKIPQPSMTLIWMNVSKGPTANVKVRNALQLAFDYKGALDQVLLGNGSIAKGVIPNNYPCRPDVPAARRDVAAAKRLLREAGATNLELTLGYQPNNADQTREATLFQSNLREIGVTVKLVPILFPEWQSLLTNASTIPQMMLVGDGGQYPDAGSPLTTWYLSSGIGSTNRTGIANKAVDRLLNQAVTTVNDKARCALYSRAQSMIAKAAPAVFMFTTWQPVVSRWNIRGIAYSSTVRPVDPTTIQLP